MIHSTADVHTKDIGDNTVVWQFAVIMQGAKIGSDCNINCHTFIENDVILGNRVTIKSGVYLWDGLRIADDVFVGPNVTFTNDNNPRSKKHSGKYFSATLEKGCSIGANSTIVGALTIGEYCLIGAGSVVTKNLPPFSLAFGNPAKVMGEVDKSGNIIKRYTTNGNSLP